MARTVERPYAGTNHPAPTDNAGHTSASRSAFTLLELITVVAIILVLTGMTVPVLLAKRANRAKNVCAANLRQLWTGFALYANDNDDTLPMAHYDGQSKTRTRFSWQAGSGAAPATWADLILGYVKQRASYSCPSDDSGNAYWPRGSSSRTGGWPLSYAMNAYLFHQPGVDVETITGGGLSELPSPASKILVVEASSAISPLVATPADSMGADGAQVWERHLGGANWLFADGHIRLYRLSAAQKAVPKSVWADPKLAEKQRFPQWIPWLRT